MEDNDCENPRNTGKEICNQEFDELRTAVYNGIKSEIIDYYNAEEIEFKDSQPGRMLVDFFSYLYRVIPAAKRKVYYSNEIRQKIDDGIITKEQSEILHTFEKAFNSGEDMNAYLSQKTKGSRNPDFLLYTWHLFHLHLSNKADMKNNRSENQLICIVKKDAVYFVDVIVHPKKAHEYFDIQHLKIIINNGWIEQIGFHSIPGMVLGSMTPVITDGETLFKLYSSGMNTGFEFEGIGYATLDPIMVNKRPFVVTETINTINGNLFDLRKKKDSYVGVKMCNIKGLLALIAAFKSDNPEVLECYDLITRDLKCYLVSDSEFQKRYQ